MLFFWDHHGKLSHPTCFFITWSWHSSMQCAPYAPPLSLRGPVICSLKKKKKSTRNEAACLLRGCHMRPCSFCLVSWGTCFWSPGHLLRGRVYQGMSKPRLCGKTTDKHPSRQIQLMPLPTVSINCQHVHKDISRWIQPTTIKLPLIDESPCLRPQTLWRRDKPFPLFPIPVHDQSNPNLFFSF